MPTPRSLSHGLLQTGTGKHQSQDLPATMHAVDAGLCAAAKASPAEGSG